MAKTWDDIGKWDGKRACDREPEVQPAYGPGSEKLDELLTTKEDSETIRTEAKRHAPHDVYGRH